MAKKMTAKEQILAKKALCEIIEEVFDGTINWHRKGIMRTWDRDAETGDSFEREKREDEVDEWDSARLKALEIIEEALVALI